MIHFKIDSNIESKAFLVLWTISIQKSFSYIQVSFYIVHTKEIQKKYSFCQKLTFGQPVHQSQQTYFLSPKP